MNSNFSLLFESKLKCCLCQPWFQLIHIGDYGRINAWFVDVVYKKTCHKSSFKLSSIIKIGIGACQTLNYINVSIAIKCLKINTYDNKSFGILAYLMPLFWLVFMIYFAFQHCISHQMSELCKNIREIKSILYGNSESEPVSEACAQLTQEFFREDTLRLLILCLPKLTLEVSMLPFQDQFVRFNSV